MINFRKIFAVLKKNRAKIGFGVGIAGSVGATVWALKKGSDFQKDAAADIAAVKYLKSVEDKTDVEYEHLREARKAVWSKGFKHFGGVAVLELASCTIATVSFTDVSKRLAEATAALAAVHEFSKVEVAEPEQIETEEQKQLTSADWDLIEAKKLGFGPCAVRLTDEWPEWNERRQKLVTELLHYQDTVEDKLMSRPEFGLFLSVPFEDLRLDTMERYSRQTKLSRTYGWYGDMDVDFGLQVILPDGSRELTMAAQKFIDCEVDYLWLNFNAEPIFDKVF